MAAPTVMSLPTEPSALLAEAPRMVGRFAIRGEIGRGSNGVVYAAFDPVLAREVAIKAIPLVPGRTWSAKLEANFINEAKAVAGLNHPYIVTVFDAGKTERLAYLAMERLHGRDLHDLIASGQRLSYQQIAGLMARIADAVHYAHKRGLIHRDIKPSNIFIQRDGKPKILDFGVALGRIAEDTAGGKRQLIGTPNYMSPEQALGQPLDARTDIFSIGAIFYELLAGRRAFEGQTIDETLMQVIAAAPPPLSSLRSDVPPQLIEICQRALQRDPARRYQTAGELRNALAEFIGRSADVAANVPRARAPGWFGSRQRPVTAAAAVRVAAAAAGAAAAAAALTLLPRQPSDAPTPATTGLAAKAASADAEASAPPMRAPLPEPPTVTEEPAAVHAPAAAPGALATPARPARALPAATTSTPEGIVALAIAPWGEVWVDGIHWGVAPPLSRLTLAPGTYLIEVRNGDAPPFAARVEVQAGQTLHLKHRF
ncbi:MAG: serine/threonine-protein kinase [Sutterellaceae bacterium]|nr:serine/threonine protein kinase [Burkholderiaceae bacterium]MDW8429632.1 serine/threonine-protein kinase [Sutterellaceae bacterium]